jgi:elongation factor G
MKVSVDGPSEFAGNIFSSLTKRRGIIISSAEDGIFVRVDAEVPLKEMFGYSTTLRSLTQGKAEFTMEFLKYSKVPKNIAEELITEYKDKKK